ncbi:MAG: VTT domain-containing protein [Actinomycetota bacterium]
MPPPLPADGPVVVPAPDLEVGPLARRFVLVLTSTLFVIGTIGSNIGPALVDERPELVLALSSRNRNLLGSVPFIDPLPFALIGFIRVLLAGVALFFLGRWYGRKAIEWTEGQVGQLPSIYTWFQRAVDRAGWLMVIVMPGSNLVCLMAGHRRMPPPRFVVFLCIGIAAKLVVLWAGGQLFEDQIRGFLDAINDYQWYIVIGLFAITFLQSARKARRDMPEVIDEILTPDGIVVEHRSRHPEATAAAATATAEHVDTPDF